MARVAPQTADSTPLDPSVRRPFYPIDTSVTAPQVPQNNDFLDLARGLQAFNPNLQNFLQDTNKQYTESEIAQARDDAIRSGVSYRDGVANGTIDPNHSPFYVRAWKELDGANLGDQISAQINTAWQTDPIKNSNDPQAFQQWLQGQISSHTQGVTDPAIMAGLAPKIGQLHKLLGAKQEMQASDNAYSGMINAASVQMGGAIDSYMGTLNEDESADPTKVIPALQAATSLTKFAGITKADATKLQSQVVAQRALQWRDPALLDVLDASRPDGTPGSGLTVEGQTLRAKIEGQIDALNAADNAQAVADDAAARKQAIQEGQDRVASELIRTGTVSKETLLSFAGKPGAKEILEAANAMTEGTHKVNDYVPPQAFAQALSDLHTGANYLPGETPTAAVVRMVQAHQVPAQDVEKMFSDAQSLQDTGLYKNADYKRMIGQISGEINDPLFGKIFDKPELRSQATNEFAANAATAIQKLKAANNDNPQTELAALAAEQQALIKKYQAMNGGSVAPPPDPTPKATDISGSGTSKLDTMRPADQLRYQQMLKAPGADVAGITKDLKNKYTSEALGRFLHIQ